MLELPVNIGKDNEHFGYAWCGGVCRWGTTEKLITLDKYCTDRNAYCYVGIAYDETERLQKERKPYKLFPLAEWEMTEADCLNFCRERETSVGRNMQTKSRLNFMIFSTVFRVGVALTKIFGSYGIFGSTSRTIGYA